MAFVEPHPGLRIHYEVHGPAEQPAVLLISNLGADLDSWYAQIPALAARYRVISFDHRFEGQTQAPDQPCTLADFARDALAVLDAIGAQRAGVIGAAIGGCVAQELVFAQPGRVWALVLACTTAGGRLATVSHADRFAQAKRLQALPPGERGLAFARQFFGPRAVDANPDAYQPIIDRAGWDTDQDPDPDLDRRPQNLAIAQFDASDWVAEIETPTLVLHGEDDIVIPPDDGRQLARAIPPARFRLLPGGHLFFSQHGPLFNEAVLEFFKQQRPDRDG